MHQVRCEKHGGYEGLTLVQLEFLYIPDFWPRERCIDAGSAHFNMNLVRWDSVALEVRMIISQQLKSQPDYAIATSGHSLGGVLALFSAIMLKQHHPDTCVHTIFDHTEHEC
jgi:hypothetical protein